MASVRSSHAFRGWRHADICVGAFAFKTWVLVSWPRANGTVIDSTMTMKKAADGTAECAAVESVQYFADGQSFIVKDGGRKLARDCAGVERTLAALRGQPRTIAYNKSLPDATYTNPAFNAEFYRDGLLLARIAILAGILGLAAIQRHRRLKCRR